MGKRGVLRRVRLMEDGMGVRDRVNCFGSMLIGYEEGKRVGPPACKFGIVADRLHFKKPQMDLCKFAF